MQSKPKKVTALEYAMNQLTLSERRSEDITSAVHLLLVAPTKMGKSSYAARAAADGFRLLYIDSDNGITALNWALKDDPEASERVHVVSTKHPAQFWSALFRATAKNPLRWNLKLDREYGSTLLNQTDDDPILVLDYNNFPEDLVLVLDSWTSLASDSLGLGASSKNTTVMDMAEANMSQGVYGDAANRVNFISDKLQQIQCHCIVQAHDTFYERYEKPTGKQGSVKQKDMVLIETLQVPISTSRPQGYNLGLRFNHIGWLNVDRAGRTQIDFTRRPDRVGGGPPNKIAFVSDLPFSALVEGNVKTAPVDDSWFKVIKAGELLEVARATRAANQAKSSGTAKPTVAKPTQGFAAFNMKK
jgi:hypothetical protein